MRLLLAIYFSSIVPLWSTNYYSLLLKVQFVFVFFATVVSENVFFPSYNEEPKASTERVKGCQHCGRGLLGDLALRESASTPSGKVMALKMKQKLYTVTATICFLFVFLLYSEIKAVAVDILCGTDQFHMIVREFLSWPLTSAGSSYVATQWKVIKRVVVLKAWCSRSSGVVTRYSSIHAVQYVLHVTVVFGLFPKKKPKNIITYYVKYNVNV